MNKLGKRREYVISRSSSSVIDRGDAGDLDGVRCPFSHCPAHPILAE